PCCIAHMPLLRQDDPRLDADVKDRAPKGNYDAALTMAVAAALANRPPARPFQGRTATLDALRSAGSGGVPSVIAQMSQVYRWTKAGQPFGLPEVVRDAGPIQQAVFTFDFLVSNEDGVAFL